MEKFILKFHKGCMYFYIQIQTDNMKRKKIDNFTYKNWVGQFVTLTDRSKVKTFLRKTMSN